MKGFPCTLGIFILHTTDSGLSKIHIHFKSVRAQRKAYEKKKNPSNRKALSTVNYIQMQCGDFCIQGNRSETLPALELDCHQ